MEILKELHNFVPFTGDNEYRIQSDQGIVGDQLTVERAVNGHTSPRNGFTPKERQKGLHFKIADWHAGNKFLPVNITEVSSQDTILQTLLHHCAIFILLSFYIL